MNRKCPCDTLALASLDGPLTSPEGKSQAVRLMDVFLLGPFMVWGGIKLAEAGHDTAGVVLGAAGIGTVAYNGSNYLRLRNRGSRR